MHCCDMKREGLYSFFSLAHARPQEMINEQLKSPAEFIASFLYVCRVIHELIHFIFNVLLLEWFLNSSETITVNIIKLAPCQVIASLQRYLMPNGVDAS